MLHFGRNALADPNKVIRSAHFVQQEVGGHGIEWGWLAGSSCRPQIACDSSRG